MNCSFATPAELSWLAGWLEGEGSFLAPPPSDPHRARVSAVTRDLDVIGRVARILGVSPTRAADRRSRERGWNPLFRILCRGSRAVELMNAIEPIMGTRRVPRFIARSVRCHDGIPTLPLKSNPRGRNSFDVGLIVPDVASRGPR